MATKKTTLKKKLDALSGENVGPNDVPGFTERAMAESAPALITGALLALEKGVKRGEDKSIKHVLDMFRIRPQPIKNTSVFQAIIQGQVRIPEPEVKPAVEGKVVDNYYLQMQRLLDQERKDSRGKITTPFDRPGDPTAVSESDKV